MIFFSFDSVNISTAASSNFGHQLTTFGKLREGIIVVSGMSLGAEVELFDNEQWIRQPDFIKNYIYSYSTATIDNKLYIFGKRKLTNFNYCKYTLLFLTSWWKGDQKILKTRYLK